MLVPLDFSQDPNRNACRRLAPEKHFLDIGHDDNEAMNNAGERRGPKIQTDVYELKAQDGCSWEAHVDVIKAVQYINATDKPLVFTAGLDKMASIWDLEGNKKGQLAQGYMMKANYYWDFPLSDHDAKNAIRK